MRYVFLSIYIYLTLVSSQFCENKKEIWCNMVLAITDENGYSKSNIECEYLGQFTTLPLDLKNFTEKENLRNGNLKFNLTDFDMKTGIIPPISVTSRIKVERQRTPSLSSGVKRLLVIRVLALDTKTTATKEELSDKIFGTRGDSTNLKKQYQACSYNKLNFVPAVAAGVIGGVLEVSLPQNIKKVSHTIVRNAISTVLNGKPQYADHVMYCIPPGVDGVGIAYAYMNHWLTVYNDGWCKSLSAQMHEIGHNRK